MKPAPSLSERDEARGGKITDARRAAGLTEKQLADRLGVSLWELDRLERGEADPVPYVEALSEHTGQPLTVLDGPLEPAQSGVSIEPSQSGLPEDAGRLDNAGYLVLASIAALVLIRFFTETAGIIPRALNFIDVPIALVLIGAAVLSKKPAQQPDRFTRSVLPLAAAFLTLSGIAVLANPTRVAVAPALVFVYGVLSPLAVYRAVLQLWPTGCSLSASKALAALGVAQLVVVTLVDLPRFLVDSNPDLISGTFGTNAYQFVFFVLVFIALVAGTYSFERNRLISRFGPALIVLSLLYIVLAQYRALLVATAVSLIVLTVILSAGPGRARGRVVAGFIILAFVGTLAFGAQKVPILKLNETFDVNPSEVVQKRFDIVSQLFRLYRQDARFILTGSGPGTYSSRGWQTFALSDSNSDSNVQGGYAKKLTGGQVYRTDVSDRYVRPLLRVSNDNAVAGSRAASSPYSDYTSVAAEVGIIGLLIFLSIYVAAFIAALRRAIFAAAEARPGDPLPALLLAVAIAFLVLIQMGALENWLEVTRLTFIAFALLAISTKEYNARLASSKT